VGAGLWETGVKCSVHAWAHRHQLDDLIAPIPTWIGEWCASCAAPSPAGQFPMPKRSAPSFCAHTSPPGPCRASPPLPLELRFTPAPPGQQIRCIFSEQGHLQLELRDFACNILPIPLLMSSLKSKIENKGDLHYQAYESINIASSETPKTLCQTQAIAQLDMPRSTSPRKSVESLVCLLPVYDLEPNPIPIGNLLPPPDQPVLMRPVPRGQ